jgi:hypothetical protein
MREKQGPEIEKKLRKRKGRTVNGREERVYIVV